MWKILTLNNISIAGLERFPRDCYEVASELGHPDAILVRSANLHQMEIPETVKAIGRAGAGVNNIPVAAMSARGVPVFNAPGANANAVKELVIAGLFLAARNIPQAWRYTLELKEQGDALHKQVEQGKKQFVGFELPGKVLGVIGLGAIGVEVANTALNLGMDVIGYDPALSVERAWQLSSSVRKARSIEEVMSEADFVTCHVPLVDSTKHLINADRLRMMKPGATLLNFSRDKIVDDEAVLAALREEHLKYFVTDFPSEENKSHPHVIALPHLGASTHQAEENCAIMVANQLRDYLENGNIANSVNFPVAQMPRAEGSRVTIANENIPAMVSKISAVIGDANLNIIDLLNKSRGDLAYTMIDLEGEVAAEVIQKLCEIEGVLAVRVV
ncbi:MAG TPA: 3-phosphoglycerate dehydrogenase [Gammaproteobacteria bacterium]|nr:3-phosphoglycerate dehydrogenase [Gammaproteobacteria bacterium]